MFDSLEQIAWYAGAHFVLAFIAFFTLHLMWPFFRMEFVIGGSIGGAMGTAFGVALMEYWRKHVN